MKLKILLPTHVLVDADEVTAVMAEDTDGRFALYPRHIDFVTTVAPGVLSYRLGNGAERFAAVDTGILVKEGDQVSISTRRAAVGDDLDRLHRRVTEAFVQQNEQEKRMQTALARLQSNFVKRFVEIS